MKKLILGIIVVIALFGVLVWFAKPNAGATNIGGGGSATSTLAVIGDDSFDFGSISMAAGNVSKLFTVKNSGTEPVLVKSVYTSCMCTAATFTLGTDTFGPFGMPGHGVVPMLNKSLAPGEEAVVDVVFDPAAHGPAGVGLIKRVVVLENDSGDPVQLKFSAVVTP